MPDDLYKMWYAMYKAPAIGIVTNVTMEDFLSSMDDLVPFEDAKSTDDTTKKKVDGHCEDTFKSVLRENAFLEPLSCTCTHSLTI